MNKYPRDVAYSMINSFQLLMTSIDFSGGIGRKVIDPIQYDIRGVSYFVARTAISELLCLGCPVYTISIGSTLLVDERPQVEKGVLQLIEEVGIKPSLVFSHENYVNCQMTAISVNCSGIVNIDKIKWKDVLPNSFCYLYGNGYTGTDISPYDPKNPSLNYIKKLLNYESVTQIIPVGSKGILNEIESLCQYYNYSFETQIKMDNIQGGPGLLFLCLASSPLNLNDLKYIGNFKK